jgi:hypothetical protein
LSPTNYGYDFPEGYTEADLARYLNEVITSSKSYSNSRIIFIFLVIAIALYPLQDPRNIKANSEEELNTRTPRGRSLGIEYKTGRKRSKIP